MSTSPTASRPTNRWLPTLGWSALSILGLILVVYIATVTFGAVHGTEFCPQTFERRTYSYYELPIVGWQVTGERHEDVTGGTEQAITTNKLLPTATSPKKDWHVLLGSRGTSRRQPGDAGILMSYLDATEEGSNLRWENWTDDAKTRPLASVLWPAVQQLALRERYVLIPDLFDLAQQCDDPQTLQAAINKALARRLLAISQTQAKLGRPDIAQKLAAEASAYEAQKPASPPAADSAEPGLAELPLEADKSP